MVLAGKSIVVTGGNSAIGEAIVLAAATEGANITIDYVAHPDGTTALIAKAQALGGQAVGVHADVSQAADLQRMTQTAVEAYGRLDVLINNAGIETRTTLLDTTEVDLDKVMAINLRSAFFGAQAAARQFIAQGGGGLILNVSSVHEDWPMPGNVAYCVSKGGIRMLRPNLSPASGCAPEPSSRRRVAVSDVSSQRGRPQTRPAVGGRLGVRWLLQRPAALSGRG